MNPSELKKRERIFIDIADGACETPSEDLTKWHSNKRNIGPLQPKWYLESSLPHVMWCYKNVTITCKYFGLQTLVENLIRKKQEMIFKRSMSQMIIQMDEWDGLTIEQIRQLEDKTQKNLEKLIQSSDLSEE